MPMKAMIYKTLSTVVDDFFAYAVHLIDDLRNIPLTYLFRQVLYQDANTPPSGLLPRRRGVPDIFIPGRLNDMSLVSMAKRDWLQRWIYRVDPKRVNEYGQVMATDIDAAKAREKNKEKSE